VSIVSEAPDRDALRIGTAEREDAVRILGEHFAAGRLPMDEYEDRVTVALEAQTFGDLRPLFKDLPAPHPGFMTQPALPAAPLPVPVHGSSAPVVYSDKSKIAAGLLQIMLPFGIGRFYTGHTHIAVAQLLLVFAGVGVVWSIIDGILLLINGGTDGQGRRLRDT
jgi:uncharacterized protein DUF1707/TM2 domain-containing protein